MFVERFEKTASNIYRGLEHAGLGVLQLPAWKSILEGRKRGQTKDERKSELFHSGAEIAGLGLLHGAVEAGHKGTAFNKFLKRNFPKMMK